MRAKGKQKTGKSVKQVKMNLFDLLLGARSLFCYVQVQRCRVVLARMENPFHVKLINFHLSLVFAGLPQTFPYHYDWAENETNDDDNTNNHLELERLDNTNTIGPYFDYDSFHNETVMVGHTAYLKCKVKNIGNKTVSWVRHRDINLLTVGLNSYTSDNRFLSIHEHDAEEWTLKVSTSSYKQLNCS
jgi:hypothetical protein